MPLIGIDHVQLAMPEGAEAQARVFFAGLLGMREIAKPATLSPKGCWFESDGVNLHLGVDPDFRPSGKAHPAFLVDDLDDLRTRLEEAGVETIDDKPIEGCERFFTHDPFGNRMEFMQRTPRAG